MARVAVTISLSDDERAELEELSRRRKTAQGLARRARIVLAAAEGLENKEIAVRSRGERGHRGQVASPLCGGGPRRSVRRASPRRATSNRR